jgi:hypothetical protein
MHELGSMSAQAPDQLVSKKKQLYIYHFQACVDTFTLVAESMQDQCICMLKPGT